ncbi:hypothetical protein AVEN_209260-1 [Araneus ventricosus]|uniref:Uncharacterized protein n=1 Tax=Araneus ventricosus TaxID=182803 RepID=A0A4Y2JMH1_ARAVE|nr:hypothetical protein AVEN_168726-1 [Araneus ventricosus]GBM91183.1 hypothetical protein AVEN_209260-1 [Araneus ventricosus]
MVSASTSDHQRILEWKFHSNKDLTYILSVLHFKTDVKDNRHQFGVAWILEKGGASGVVCYLVIVEDDKVRHKISLELLQNGALNALN